MFRTELPAEKYDFSIGHSDHLSFIGSCFSDNIASQLKEGAFAVQSNPFGVLYNPASVQKALDLLMGTSYFQESDLFEHKGLFHSFYHHSSFSASSVEQTLNTINKGLKTARTTFAKSNILFLTWGSAYVYENKTTQEIVSNCHKLPAKMFKHYLLKPQDIVDSYRPLIKQLQYYLPHLKIVFTVSPVRYVKTSFRENQLSKSYLHYAINQLETLFSSVYYYPSYEIVMDDLRDYRFFKDDLIHPNQQAVNYIYKHFKSSFFNADTQNLEQQVLQLRRAFQHRPFNPETEEHQIFLKRTHEKLNQLKNRYPYLAWD